MIPFKVEGQDNRLVELRSWEYEYITNLQHRGYLLELNPTALPYAMKEVGRALREVDEQSLTDAEKKWFNQLHKKYSSTKTEQKSDISYGIEFSGSVYAGNSRRKSSLRPLDNKLFVYPMASVGGYIRSDHFVAHANIRHNLYYDRDPDGLDSARRLYIRSEDAYLGYNSELLDIYLGRFKNHWAPHGETSSILSSNPNSFDQVSIRFGSEKIALRSVVGELDNISPNNTFDGFSFGQGAKRRYLVAHRVDWRPTKHFGIGFFESVIYSGSSSGFSFKYINPLHTLGFVSDNKPKNDENNLQLGGLLWAQWNGFTFNGQLMLDDFQVEDNLEKHTFTITASLYKARLFDNLDLAFEFETVSYQTYNPTQPEGRYLYMKRGLATQFNDYVLGSLYANIYAPNWMPGLQLTPKVELLLQGEQTINQPLVFTYPDGTPLEYVLTGNEERTFRPSLSFRYQRDSSFWIEGNAGINFVRDVNNQPGVDKTRFAGSLSLGVDFTVFSGSN